MKDILIHSDRITAHVNAFGAELKGLALDGVEYLYDGDTVDYERTSPTLFPIIGRFLSDTYYVGNTAYHMPLNGFALNRNFAVEAQGDDFVRFKLCDDQRSRALYPFAFQLYVEYHLANNRMRVSYRVVNTGKEELPFCLGCHTAYRWPLLENERPDDYCIVFEQEEKLDSFNPFNWKDEGFVNGSTRPLTHRLFANFTRSFTGIRSSWIEFRGNSGHAVRIHRAEMPYIALWTTPNESGRFICIEPCTSVHAGSATTMNDRNGVIVLEAGKICNRQFEIELR